MTTKTLYRLTIAVLLVAGIAMPAMAQTTESFTAAVENAPEMRAEIAFEQSMAHLASAADIRSSQDVEGPALDAAAFEASVAHLANAASSPRLNELAAEQAFEASMAHLATARGRLPELRAEAAFEASVAHLR
ncbi:MAG: hypothetical protein Kow0077_28740 [Anaerolineae bacterium]